MSATLDDAPPAIGAPTFAPPAAALVSAEPIASSDIPVVAEPPVERRLARVRRAQGSWQGRLATVVVALAAAVGVLQFHTPPRQLRPRPFEVIFGANASPDAFGRSGEVKVRFSLPGERVEFPLAVNGDPSRLRYTWQRAADQAVVDSARPLRGAALVAPSAPGFYRLVVEQQGARRVVPEVTLAVMVPFEEKSGSTLEGYRIGTYLAEKLGASHGRPEGFVRVDQATAGIALSTHFRVGDFLSHDGQRQWPRFAAVNPRLIDKLELVIAEVAKARGNPDSVRVQVNVNAGFRSPSYNRTVSRAARDSRHQYGDAADVAIDADFDGRLTRNDSRIVAAAVDRVEAEHPDLVGGMGLYLSSRYAHSYVHIDARGKRARWKG